MPRAINVTDSHTVSVVRKHLMSLYAHAEPRSWRAVASWLGMKPVNAAMLARIAKGKQKPPDSLLSALHIPVVKMTLVPEGYGVGRACPKCGKVHTTRRCTSNGKPKQIRYKTIQEMSLLDLRAAFENRG